MYRYSLLLLLLALPVAAEPPPPADEGVHQLGLRQPADLLPLLSPQGVGPLTLSALAHDLNSGDSYSHTANYPQVVIHLDLEQQPQPEATIDLQATGPLGFTAADLAGLFGRYGMIATSADAEDVQYLWSAEGFDCLVELNMAGNPSRLSLVCQNAL